MKKLKKQTDNLSYESQKNNTRLNDFDLEDEENTDEKDDEE